MPSTERNPATGFREVMTRNTAARHIVAGFAAAMPAMSEVWRTLDSALADAGDLAADVVRLSAELAAVRLHRANLLAAMRAALGAQRDGEPDPLSYLRDELETPQNGPEAHGGGNRA